jgi:hypothetical protein
MVYNPAGTSAAPPIAMTPHANWSQQELKLIQQTQKCTHFNEIGLAKYKLTDIDIVIDM